MDYRAVRTLLQSLEGDEHLIYEKILVHSTGLSVHHLLFDFDYYVYRQPSRIARPRPIPVDPAIHRGVIESFNYFFPVLEDDYSVCESIVEAVEHDHVYVDPFHAQTDEEVEVPDLFSSSLDELVADFFRDFPESDTGVELAQAPVITEPAHKPHGQSEPKGYCTESELSSDVSTVDTLHPRRDVRPKVFSYADALARPPPTGEPTKIVGVDSRKYHCGSRLETADERHSRIHRQDSQDLKHNLRLATKQNQGVPHHAPSNGRQQKPLINPGKGVSKSKRVNASSSSKSSEGDSNEKNYCRWKPRVVDKSRPDEARRTNVTKPSPVRPPDGQLRRSALKRERR